MSNPTTSPLGLIGGPILSTNLPTPSNAGINTAAFTSDQGPLVSSGIAWNSLANSPVNNVIGNAAAAVRNQLYGSHTVKGLPFNRMDPSVLVDIGVTAENPLSLWTDVSLGTMVPVNFASAPSSTSGTLLNGWTLQTSAYWTVVLSTGQVITGCTLTYGSTSVTLGSSVTGSPTANATATLWVYTAATGSSINNTTGFTPGATAGEYSGRVAANGFDKTHGASGTVFVRVARQAITADQSQSSTSAWYDGVGNTGNANSGSYPPCLFNLEDEAGNSFISWISQLAVSGVNYGAQGQRAPLPGGATLTLVNPPNIGANFDSTYVDVAISWQPINYPLIFTALVSASTSATLVEPWPWPTSANWIINTSAGPVSGCTLTNGSTSVTLGSSTTCSQTASVPTSQFLYYFDNILCWNGITIPNSTTGLAAIQNGQFCLVGIGNVWNGYSAYLGGSLGPFPIRRFQISSAFSPPVVSDCVVGFIGDSYVSGGGSNGAVTFPGSATPGVILQDAQLLLAPDNPISPSGVSYGISGGATGGPSGLWIADLQAYCKKQLGFYFRAPGASKSGYSTYFTGGYTGAMAMPPVSVSFTAALSGATSGTLASIVSNGASFATWPMATGPYTLTFPDGVQRVCTLTLQASTCTWVGSLTEPNAATLASSVYTTGYWDSLVAFNPEVIVYHDSVNNGFECPNTTGVGVTPIADTNYIFSYLASRCSNLRAILCIEMPSLENLPTAMGGSLTPAQWVTVSALFRGQMRTHYNAGSATAGMGSVTYTNAAGAAIPLIYIPTYESFAGSAVFGASSIASASQSTSTGVFTTLAQAIVAGLPVQIGGTPPTGFNNKTTYYAIASSLSTSAVKLSATAGGAAIVPTVSSACTLIFPYAYCLTLGSNPLNINTTTSEGPTGSLPNIHPTPDGEIAIADKVWPLLKPYLQNRQHWANA